MTEKAAALMAAPGFDRSLAGSGNALEALIGELFPALPERPAVYYSDRVTSTNDWGKALPRRCVQHISSQAPEQSPALCDLRLLLADTQTAGRGRLGRAWHSPPGENLYMTLVLDGSFEPVAARFLPLAAGLALQCALQAELEIPLKLKWPNDLIADGRKLAGILCESRLGAGGIERLVLGLGLNVRQSDFPPELSGFACSLKQLCPQKKWRRTALVARFLSELAVLLPVCLGRADAALLLADYEALCLNIGRAAEMTQADGKRLSGLIRGLTPDGSLLLEDEQGLLHELCSGEVTLGSAPPMY